MVIHRCLRVNAWKTWTKCRWGHICQKEEEGGAWEASCMAFGIGAFACCVSCASKEAPWLSRELGFACQEGLSTGLWCAETFQPQCWGLCSWCQTCAGASSGTAQPHLHLGGGLVRDVQVVCSYVSKNQLMGFTAGAREPSGFAQPPHSCLGARDLQEKMSGFISVAVEIFERGFKIFSNRYPWFPLEWHK